MEDANKGYLVPSQAREALYAVPFMHKGSNFQRGHGYSREAGRQPFLFVLKLQLALTLTQARGQQNNRGLGVICNSDLIFWSLLPTTRSRTGKNRKLGKELPSHLPLGETPTLMSGQGQ